jgi:hypothetical protein
MHTPFFPAWRPRLAPLKAVVHTLRAQALPHLQGFFDAALPPEALGQEESGPHSRQRVFSVRRTFWAFLGQVLHPACSCREAVRQMQALLELAGKRSISQQTSAYCQARAAFPMARLHQILGQSARNLRAKAGSARLWREREVKVVDGSSSSLPDTPANQKKFPQQKSQKPGCGFPTMKFVGLFSLATGAALAVATGSLRQGELLLFRRIWNYLKVGDVLLADRGFADYTTLAELWQRGVDCVARVHAGRRPDFREGHFLGPGDRLVTWTKPLQRAGSATAKLWAALPAELTVRLIKARLAVRGFRTRELIVITTLLDPEKFPAEEIAALYRRRWQVELFFRDIKTTLQMETLRCQSPAMIAKEFLMHMIAYNLIRAVMWEAARRHETPLERISFKGALDALRQFSLALARARSQKKARQIERELLRIIAKDRVPERPGRREPRAVKRRPKPFCWLSKPRHLYKEIPHRGKYRKPVTR